MPSKTRVERGRKEVIKTAEFTKLKQFLARSGVTPAQISAAIGSGAGARSREEIGTLLRNWLHFRPGR